MRQDSHLSFWTIVLYTEEEEEEEEGPYRPIRISRDNHIIKNVDLPGGSTKISLFIWAMSGVFRFGPALIR